MEQRTRLLLALAADWEAQGAYAAAVKCLAAAAADAGELPAVLAQARLRLAALLLAHFDNFQEAKNMLLAAEQELRQTQGHHLLKCEVWDALALANQRLGAVGAEADALAAGLKACRQGAASKDREALARWHAYFLFKLAEHALTHKGHEAAAEALQALEHPDAAAAASPGRGRPPALSPLERVLCLLCRATLALHAGDFNAAGSTIGAASPLLEEAAGGDRDSALFKQLTCHYSLVYLAMVIQAGRINEVTQDGAGNIQMLMTLAQHLADVAGQPWGYAWLPPAAVGAIGNLLHASLLRSLGKAVPAVAYLAAAQEAVEQQLQALGVDLQACNSGAAACRGGRAWGTERQLSAQAMWGGRLWCQLAVLLEEQHVLAALLASRFARAAERLAGLGALLGRFPTLLRDLIPSLQMLLGWYAHSVGEYAAAGRHFEAVLASDAALLHDSAALAAAGAALHAHAGPAGVRAVAQLLEPRQLTELPHVLSLAVHDRTAALVCNGLRAHRGGDDGNARVLLTKALKAAHTQLGNTQLVSQVLNVLAPIQASKGDRAGAEQMLTSSATLARAQEDLSTLVTSSRCLLALFAGTPGEEAQAAQQAAAAEAQAAELEAAVAAARALPCHAALLAWQPPAAQ